MSRGPAPNPSRPPAERIAGRLEWRQIRYFLVLAEELNYRRAAERLHLTQPPLSRQIAALEAALGVSLFDRDTVGTRLTAAGQVAKREFTRALRGVDAAVQVVIATAPPLPASFRLGLPWWGDLSRLGAFERALRASVPMPAIETSPGHSADLLAAVLRGELAAAVVTLPIDLQGLRHCVVARLAHVALLPSTSALARKRVVSLADLATLPAFLRFQRRDNPSLWAHYQRLYDAAGFVPRKLLAASDPSVTIPQIAAGQAATVMPAVIARQRYPGVSIRRLKDPVHVEVALVWSTGLGPALDDALRRAAPSLADMVV